ncbi:hypothetical protein F5148DRAFT_585705 [Russula earlei]|uniref:Uncharacterized protein n=1 Tax=Russula earlei TaxID=71964 RepID=A0ACC0TX72_9AGAM|nr:hypothetical protein F5148DRAFT_585705 [Russula earlei]
MSHLPYDTFRETLAIRYPNCGHALWEPSSGGLYDSVEVGDVGFIREGCFHRLFNVFLPKEHPSHSNFGVPEDHQQLPLNVPNHIHKVRDGTDDFCSRHVSLVSNERNVHAWGPDDDPQVTVTCPGRRGAMLSLPSRAQREDTIARGAFGKWMVKHIDLWVAFAETLGLGVNRMQDIILVTGRHCAKSWINVAFSDSHRDAEVSFGVRLSGSSGVTVERRAVRGDATLKLGPSGEDLPENQCIFVRGFRVVRMWNIWPRLRGGAGPPSDTGGNDPEFGNDKFLEPLGSPFDTSFPDPLHVLLQYIAELV